MVEVVAEMPASDAGKIKPKAKRKPGKAAKETKKKQLWENLTQANRHDLYSVARLLGKDTRERLMLEVPFLIHIEDPSFLRDLDPVFLSWAPSWSSGPRSPRLVVVDYDADTGEVRPSAFWDAVNCEFLEKEGGQPVLPPVGTPVRSPYSPQFRQVHAWAVAEAVLDYCEDSLGRSIPWGFEGSRLMIVPAAGLQNNAFYDRDSKSVQFYYFGARDAPSYTSLAHDIVAHEVGHAILDGIRPLFLENTSWETSAFHEFFGDLLAVLMTIRNNYARGSLVSIDLQEAEFIAGIAKEFGEKVRSRPYLRSAVNEKNFQHAAETREPHEASEVLTGTFFELLSWLAYQYLLPERQETRKKEGTLRNALWWTASRIEKMALQPIDLLPPVDVRFSDYAAAILRNDEIVNPDDPDGYRPKMQSIFERRGLKPTEIKLPRLKFFPNVAEAARSRASAYRMLNDNRRSLGIPPDRDLVVVEPYDCVKRDPEAKGLPRHTVFQYYWQEEVVLPEEPRFHSFGGQRVPLFCGGALALDDRNNVLSFMAKPGTESEEGLKRRDQLLDHIADLLSRQRVAVAGSPEASLAFGHIDVLVRQEGNLLRFSNAPHLCAAEEEEKENQKWSTSF